MAPKARQAERDHIDGLVAQWGDVRPDVDVSVMQVAGRVLRLAMRLDEAMQRNFSRLGLQPGWFDVLATLRRCDRPLAAGALCQECMLTSGGMTGRLDRMERAGLVRRTPDPDDRRGVLVELTDAGREVVDRALEAHVALLDELLAPLGARDRAALAGLLRTALLAVD